MVQEAPYRIVRVSSISKSGSGWRIELLDIGGSMGTVPRQESVSNSSMRHRELLKWHCAGAQTAVPVWTFSECVYTQQQPIVRRRILSGTSYSDFISSTNPSGMRFLLNPISITVTLFPAAHSQFLNRHNFIEKLVQALILRQGVCNLGW